MVPEGRLATLLHMRLGRLAWFEEALAEIILVKLLSLDAATEDTDEGNPLRVDASRLPVVTGGPVDSDTTVPDMVTVPWLVKENNSRNLRTSSV